MTPRRALMIVVVAAVLHNALRVIAALGGASWGIFNYLHAVHFVWDEPTLVGLSTTVLVAVIVAFVAWIEWRNPGTPNPMMSTIFWTVPTAALASLFAVMVSASADRSYGWVMFALVPFATGFHATLALSRKMQVTLTKAFSVSCLSAVLLGGLLIATAAEGVICVVMAAPLALILALLGGSVGWLVAGSKRVHSPAMFLLFIGVTPFGATIERAVQPPASLFQVTTSIDLPASPERVWQTVLQPATLAPPTQPLLKAGVGYPEASHIEGSGPSAIRYCDFSTGKLIEPVLIWDQPRELRFTVAASPLPMQEWTPYAHLHPPHLDGFLVTRQGQFRLLPLPNGGTHLEATTGYQHHLWPEQYWRWWSDYIIHGIHEMVLADIRDRSASPARQVNR